MSDEEHEALSDQMMKHTRMVLAGQLPADSLPDFVPPTGGADDKGRAWSWGPNFDPEQATQIMDADRDENAPKKIPRLATCSSPSGGGGHTRVLHPGSRLRGFGYHHGCPLGR